MGTITAAEANRAFSSLLRRASAGETVVVTSRGKPVAQIGPVADAAAMAGTERRNAAKQALLEHLRSVTPQVVGPWTREELYEREAKGRGLRVALDTNLLIYVEGIHQAPGDAGKAETIKALIDRLLPEDIVVPAQVLGELTVVLLRKGGRTRSEARDIALRWLELAGLVPETGAMTIGWALDLSAANGLQFWDSVILCAAAASGCGLLLSEDMQDGFVHRGVTVANPFAPRQHPLLASALA